MSTFAASQITIAESQDLALARYAYRVTCAAADVRLSNRAAQGLTVSQPLPIFRAAHVAEETHIAAIAAKGRSIMFPTISAATLSAALDSHGMSARKAGCLFILRCATVSEKEIKDVVSIFRASTFSRAFRDASAAARLANVRQQGNARVSPRGRGPDL
jgi:hypothetical protein